LLDESDKAFKNRIRLHILKRWRMKTTLAFLNRLLDESKAPNILPKRKEEVLLRSAFKYLKT
jgi:hypothetical protein